MKIKKEETAVSSFFLPRRAAGDQLLQQQHTTIRAMMIQIQVLSPNKLPRQLFTVSSSFFKARGEKFSLGIIL